MINSIPFFEKKVIFDSHAHYDDESFNEDRDELLSTLHLNGVCGIITCGCDKASTKNAIVLAEKHDFIFAAAGIHPDCIDSGTSVADIEALANHEKVKAIGEIGLDYFHNSENKTAQKELFRSQIDLAKKLSLPVIVHDREAHEDTLNILKETKPKGVLHCFSGSPETAKQILELGMYIGVGGVITFKNAKRLPEVVEMLPLDRLLVETDAPYLAPEPFRGKRNHSASIYFTAKKIAEIKKMDYMEILEISAKNARELFNI